MRAMRAVLAIFAAACSSSVAPNPDLSMARYSSHSSTLLLTNAASARYEVRAYPDYRPPVPQLLGGNLHLGYVGARATVCIQIPDSVFMSGTIVTTGQQATAAWRSSDPLSVTVDDDTLQRGQTADFVPASSAGWSVTLPGPLGTGATVATAPRCAP